MSEQIWVQSHVRQLLQDIWQSGTVPVDDDGDVPFRCGTAACWVSVLDSEPRMVRVFAHAVDGLRPSAKLLTELNLIQRRSLSARVDLRHDAAVVSQTVNPIGMTAPVLNQALDAVGWLANEVGPLLAAMFGGSTPYAEELAPSDGLA